MCRFLAYKGREILMSNLLINAEQSLIRQSFNAKERKEPLNGDGFGIGWYVPEIDPTPCVFTSVQPAWSNRNLHRLAEKIRSTCFFSHVRAATRGAYVSEFNCHPFQYQQFLWMHNGKIADFEKIKRTLRDSLNDEYYNFIQGTTDSEHAFALFLNLLGDRLYDYSINDLGDALVATIQKINKWLKNAAPNQYSHLNFALSDGHNLLVTRYVSDPNIEPPSLYISTGERLEIIDGKYHMIVSEHGCNCVVIASEPLTSERSNWRKVGRNQLVLVTPELHIHQQSLD